MPFYRIHLVHTKDLHGHNVLWSSFNNLQILKGFLCCHKCLGYEFVSRSSNEEHLIHSMQTLLRHYRKNHPNSRKAVFFFRIYKPCPRFDCRNKLVTNSMSALHSNKILNKVPLIFYWNYSMDRSVGFSNNM